jgi:hypothetical protein
VLFAADGGALGYRGGTVDPDDIAARRVRLAELDAALTRLAEQYDLAMSHFKFDEARDLHARIEPMTRQRNARAAGLPPLPPSPPPAPFTLARPHRRRRR